MPQGLVLRLARINALLRIEREKSNDKDLEKFLLLTFCTQGNWAFAESRWSLDHPILQQASLGEKNYLLYLRIAKLWQIIDGVATEFGFYLPHNTYNSYKRPTFFLLGVASPSSL